jgi:Na+-translocating ferredoxin:NAD+ oxidoreductase RnfD subunit
MEQTFFDIYHFVFETFEGVAILIGAAILVSIIACAIMERKAKKALKAKQAALAEKEDREFDEEEDDE